MVLSLNCCEGGRVFSTPSWSICYEVMMVSIGHYFTAWTMDVVVVLFVVLCLWLFVGGLALAGFGL